MLTRLRLWASTKCCTDADASHFSQAYLAEVPSQSGLYRLGVKLRGLEREATFFLQPIRDEPDFHSYTPVADTTNSNEVLQLAKHWIKTCTSPQHPSCPDNLLSDELRVYPTRLIELPPYRPLTNTKSSAADSEAEVRLIITRPETTESLGRGPEELKHDDMTRLGPSVSNVQRQRVDGIANKGDVVWPQGHYVTLSHCWGGVSYFTLTRLNMHELQRGIRLSALPKTFREAIGFARRLDRSVRYIWIDPLCIIQNDAQDWQCESARMYDVYRHSFCNISATAAADSDDGLYRPRNPSHLWEAEVNFNTEGLAATPHTADRPQSLGSESMIRRCRLYDVSFWSTMVDEAPANKRAWVLQERLLAPRVIHFCQDQIAWECRHIDTAEAMPFGVPSLTLQASEVRERTRLKLSIPQQHGPKPMATHFPELAYAAHEDWKWIIELYSTRALTKPEDKLIALAGIAELIQRQIGKSVLYIAGFWEKWLASQLLWRVNAAYERSAQENERDRVPLYAQRRPAHYRAPTFSWAAIDAPGQGVKCSQTVREDDLEIRVDRVFIPKESVDDDVAAGPGPSQPKAATNLFAKARRGTYIELRCTLRAIEVEKKSENNIDRYRWRLLQPESAAAARWSYNLYLDSPIDDFSSFSDPHRKLYCVPAHRDAKGYLTCLILQLWERDGELDNYRRVGLAIIPPYRSTQTAAVPMLRRAATVGADIQSLTDDRAGTLVMRLARLQRENEALRERLALLELRTDGSSQALRSRQDNGYMVSPLGHGESVRIRVV